MNKNTAKKISESGITVGEIKAMLKRVWEEEDEQYFQRRSVVNKGCTKAVVYNIMLRGYAEHNDDEKITGLETLGAKNAIHEFGDYWDGWHPETPKDNRENIGIFHQDVIDVDDFFPF